MSEWEEAPRLLLVEGHDGLRLDLSRALEAAGYRVDAFACATRVSPVESRPPYAVLVLDAAAFDASERVEFVDPNPARTVWTWTGSELPPHASRLVELGASIVTKPFSIHTLESRIVECILRDTDPGRGLHDPILRTREPELAAGLERARRLATRDVPIVIEGELGTGRRALAQAIHGWSTRRQDRLCVVDRIEIETAGPAGILDVLERLWQDATPGSLLVAEPADWPDWGQQAFATLLRSAGAGPRLISWAQSSLEEAVAADQLALELQYRLDGVRIPLPPLRERPLDHLELCTAVARRVARSLGRSTPEVDDALVERLAGDGFPGNRIGLESRLRSALIRSEDGGTRIDAELERDVGGAAASPEESASLNLKTLERDTIVRALAHWQGNRTRASESLGISVRTLRNKIREYQLR